MIFSKCPLLRKASSLRLLLRQGFLLRKTSSREKATSSSAFSFSKRLLPPPQKKSIYLIRKASSQPGLLIRTSQRSLILEACPLEAFPSRKISSVEGFLLRDTSIDCSIFSFSVTFCSYFCARIYFLAFYLIIYLLIYHFQDNEANK